MKTIAKLSAVVALLSVAACSAAPATSSSPLSGLGSSDTQEQQGQDGAQQPSQNGATASAADCHESIVPDGSTAGCYIRLVSPQPCEEIDLSNGKSYEFAWTTDGSGCETPWTVIGAGNPASDANSVSVQLSENVEQGISKTGGVIRVTAADLASLKSDNGLYHWVVKSYYGSHPASVAFTVKQ